MKAILHDVAMNVDANHVGGFIRAEFEESGGYIHQGICVNAVE